MKRFISLLVSLALLFVCQVVWAGQAQQSIEMPSYLYPDIYVLHIEGDVDCRDVRTINHTSTLKNGAIQPALGDQPAVQLIIYQTVESINNNEGAVYLTDRTVLLKGGDPAVN